MPITTPAKKVIGVILGEQLRHTGELVPEYVWRLRAAASDFQCGRLDAIVLAGGVSTPGRRSEAEVAGDWLVLYEKIPQDCVVLEKASLTTGQNIDFCDGILQELQATEVRIYGRRSQRWKTIIFVSHFWPEHLTVTFVPCVDHKRISYRLIDQTVMIILALLDPSERHLAKWSNRLFRRFFVRPT